MPAVAEPTLVKVVVAAVGFRPLVEMNGRVAISAAVLINEETGVARIGSTAVTVLYGVAVAAPEANVKVKVGRLVSVAS